MNRDMTQSELQPGPDLSKPQGEKPTNAKRRLRLMYAAGPGDVIGTYRHWRADRDDPGQVAMTYSGQFFDVCRELGAQGWVIASHPRRETVRDDDFRVEHRTIPFANSKAPLYHLGQLWTGIRMSAAALRYSADAVVICDGTAHWFTLRLLAAAGVKIIPTIHCTFWRQAAPKPGRIKKILNRLDRGFWGKSAARVLSASREITRQLDQLTNGQHPPVIEFLPTYRRGTFTASDETPPDGPSFRVLFAGRLEVYKGVFDLLEIARRLKKAGQTQIEFDLCGNGSAKDRLIQEVAAAGLSQTFRIHGHRTRPEMRELFRQSHVLIVPTTTDFAEGFNQVVVEGVLAGRPVITSNVCPAIEYVRGAVIEVAPDNVEAYLAAIERLSQDRAFYESKRVACSAAQEQFYDPARGWAAALLRAVEESLPAKVQQ